MASLSPPFILCPLPDRKALLGVRPDRLQNKAIVTLGKNIAIRYHVLEQKQESSWTTSRYWFTSPVTFCYDLGKYGAVLNHNIVALWDEDDANLAHVTKTKLPGDAYGLHSCPSGRTVVVMMNGSAAYLSDVSEDKTIVQRSILEKNETILSFEVDERSSRCYMVVCKKVNKKYAVVVTPVEKESDRRTSRSSFGIELEQLLGFCLFFTGSDSFIVYFGSDGFVYKKTVGGDSETDSMKLINLSKYVSDRNPIVMCPLQHNSSIAIYGCDATEEGAVVLIYDIHYDLVVSKQSLKLYSTPPLMEKIGQSLFVPLGLHILVLSFRITKSLLSSVVGKHQAKLDEEVFEGRNPWISMGWDPNSEFSNEISVNTEDATKKAQLDVIKESYPTIWETVQQVKIFESEGQPEAVICNHVIPSALEKRNESALDWILDTFLDIPEVHIVSLVVYSVQAVSFSDEACETNDRLNKLFLRKFDKQLLTLSLRHVDYDVVKKLLLYLYVLIKNKWQLDVELDEDECSMKSWLKWCSALVDAHYTKFVLHNETGIIEKLLDAIQDCTKLLEAVAEVEPYLLLTHSKTPFETTPGSINRWRTETLTFD